MNYNAAVLRRYPAVFSFLLGILAAAGVFWPSTVPAQSPENGIASTHGPLPVLFIVGDSTVHNNDQDLWGWGDVIGRQFDPAKIKVDNRAVPGRSSRTFQTEGWWDKVLAAAQPGDFVLIQMGHNDGGPIDDTNRARGSLHGLGEETKDIYNPIMKRREIVHTYGWYMRKYVSDARARGMTPVICSPVPRCPKTGVKAGDAEKSDYVQWSEAVAAGGDVACVHLNETVMAHYSGLSAAEIKTRYFTTKDNTHFCRVGAELNAQSVVEKLRELSNCPLKNFLLPRQDGTP